MDENLRIDENSRNVLGGVTNDASEFIKNLRVNPANSRLIVDAHITSTNTDIGDTIAGGTPGSILFIGAGSTLAQDNANLFYDDTQNFVGFGTNVPTATLHINGTFRYADGSQVAGYILETDGNGNATWVDPTTVPGFSGYNLIQNEGSSVTQRTTINLTNLLTAADVGAKTELTINVVNLGNNTTFINTLTANTTFITNVENFLLADTTFITNLGNTLIANTTFITNLINELVNNTTFINNVSTNIDIEVALNNILTTKGDMIARTTTTPVRVGVGTDGFVLTADSGAAAGVSWQSSTGGAGYTTIQDGGTPLAQEDTLNFVNFFTVTDDPGVATDVNINVVELGGDTTFINTLTSNTLFQTNVNNFVSGSGGTTISLTAIEDITEGQTIGLATNIDTSAALAVWATRHTDGFTEVDLEPYQGITGAIRMVDDTYVLLFGAFFNTGTGEPGAITATLDRATNTWTFGTPLRMFPSVVGDPFGVTMVRLTDDKFAAACFVDTTPYDISVGIFTISGGVITPQGLDSVSTGQNAARVDLSRLADDRFAMVTGGTQAGTNVDLYEVTVDGSNIPTIGSTEVLDTATTAFSYMETINTDKVAIINDTNIWVATVSAGVWTVGTPGTLFNATVGDTRIGGIISIVTDEVWTLGSSSIQYFTVSGTTPTSVASASIGAQDAKTLATDGTDVYFVTQDATPDPATNGVARLSVSGSAITVSPYAQFDLSLDFSDDFIFKYLVLRGSDYYGVVQDTTQSSPGDNVNFDFHIQGMTTYFVGIAQNTVPRGGTVQVKIKGIDSNQTGITPGALYIAFEGGLIPTADPTEPWKVQGVNSTSVEI